MRTLAMDIICLRIVKIGRYMYLEMFVAIEWICSVTCVPIKKNEYIKKETKDVL